MGLDKETLRWCTSNDIIVSFWDWVYCSGSPQYPCWNFYSCTYMEFTGKGRQHHRVLFMSFRNADCFIQERLVASFFLLLWTYICAWKCSFLINFCFVLILFALFYFQDCRSTFREYLYFHSRIKWRQSEIPVWSEQHYVPDAVESGGGIECVV